MKPRTIFLAFWIMLSLTVVFVAAVMADDFQARLWHIATLEAAITLGTGAVYAALAPNSHRY